MRLSLLFFTVGFLLVLLQTTFLHLLPLGPIVPDLILVLCVYWGLHRATVGGVMGAFLLGYFVDAVSSPILGLNAFAMSLVFLAVYLCSRAIWIHHPYVSAVVVFLAALVKGLALILGWALFLSIEGMWAGAVKYILVEAVLAALLAPALFYLLRWGQKYLEEVSVVS